MRVIRYKCSYCRGKAIGYGEKSERYELHFCNRKCMIDYIKKYGPIQRKDTVNYCVICNKEINIRRKYCPECFDIGNDYTRVVSYRKRRNLPFISFVDYLKKTMKRRPGQEDYILSIIDRQKVL